MPPRNSAPSPAAPARPSTAPRDVVIVGAHEHNLKHVTVTIPRDSLTVVTGLSGSGKSSLAFDTLYAEGQRRYVESLSAYARQFLDMMDKPKVDHIDGLSPAISIEQKTVSKNPRSTVGTVTEIYDYLRVLYANIGRPHCARCARPLESWTVQRMADAILAWPEGTKLFVMAPVVRGRKGEYREVFERAQREGFQRAKVDGRHVVLGEEEIALDKKLKHDVSIVVARLVVSEKVRGRLVDSLETALKKAEGIVAIERVSDGDAGDAEAATKTSKPAKGKGRGARDPEAARTDEIVFSEAMACPEHGPQLVELTPRMFSFNSPFGACPSCNGLGRRNEIDVSRIVVDPDLSIADGAVAPWAGFFRAGRQRPGGEAEEDDARDEEGGGGSWGRQWILSILEHYGVDPAKPWKKLSKAQQESLLNGSGGERIHIRYKGSTGTKFESHSKYEGLVPRLERRLREASGEAADEILRNYFTERPCPACKGARLRPESLAVTIKERNIAEFCVMTVRQALEFVNAAKWDKRETQIGAQALKEIRERLRFMNHVGLDYLALDRASATLAGGEGQRIRLATQLGSQLVGVLYVLDEPSIGLHPRDNARLIETLRDLRDRGNTVVVVEHDEGMIRAADHVVDLGPGAGRLGGQVVASGPPEAIEKSRDSLTGQYLSGRRSVPVPAPADRRKPDPKRRLVVRGAREHNLKGIDVAFPLGMLVCVTGVSGSGKSTLVNDILHRRLARHFHDASEPPGAHDSVEGIELLDKVVAVDQSPIGRTPRSNPATYTGLFGEIRGLYAGLPESRVRGYGPGRFSFNVKGGRCESCKGDGLIKIEMHFLPDVHVTCEACAGRRFNRETLEILYKGRSIADALEMTIEEAAEFFDAIPSLARRLRTLCDVGLGYVQLGQSATTLSGGEAQRVKLSRELGRRATGRTLYILDEPTTGLHFEDVRKLVEVLQRLVGEGNSAIVIEHDIDVMKCADWIVDLGPEGGEGGGKLVAEGPPEKVAATKGSITGEFLKRALGTTGRAARKGS